MPGHSGLQRLPARTMARIAELIPAHVNRLKKASNAHEKRFALTTPTWEEPAQKFFHLWPKLSVCAPKYAQFLRKCDPADLKKAHVFMNPNASAELVEFYLCVALLLKPKEVRNVEHDSEALLKLAHVTAQEDVEPVLAAAQALATEYCEWTHRVMENDLSIWKELDEGMFWHHSFRRLVPMEYLNFLQQLKSTIFMSIDCASIKAAYEKDCKAKDVLLKKSLQATSRSLKPYSLKHMSASNDNVEPILNEWSDGKDSELDVYNQAAQLTPEFERLILDLNQNNEQNEPSSSGELNSPEGMKTTIPYNTPLPLEDFIPMDSRPGCLQNIQAVQTSAEEVYKSWLDKVGMPVRSTIRNCLIEHHFLHGVSRAWDGVPTEPKTFTRVNSYCRTQVGKSTKVRTNVKEQTF